MTAINQVSGIWMQMAAQYRKLTLLTVLIFAAMC